MKETAAVYLSIAARRSGESALFVRRVAVVKVRMIAFHRSTELGVVCLPLQTHTTPAFLSAGQQYSRPVAYPRFHFGGINLIKFLPVVAYEYQ